MTFLLFYLWLFYALFLIYTAIHRAKKEGRLEGMPWYQKAVLVSYIGPAFIVDIVFNYAVGWIIFAERPWGRGTTFTQRCSLRRKDSGGWRKKVADFICQIWLNVFERGHC